MTHVDTNDLGRLTGILAVDVRRFSEHNDSQQERIGTLLPAILRDAADRAGLGDIMRNSVFHAFRGDGYLIGFDPNRVADVVDRFFDSLQAELRRRAPELRAAGIALRLRASLHLGPLRSFDTLVADSPSGRLMVESGRMVDADPVRALLEHSDANVTLVATVMSEDVMKNVIEAGRTARQPSEFVAAPLRIEAKDYSGTGYLRVPVPSGDLLRYGLLHGQPLEAAEDVAQTSDGESARDALVRNDVAGNGNSVAGRDVMTSNHTVADQVFSGEFNTQGDANFGSSSGRRITERAGAEDR